MLPDPRFREVLGPDARFVHLDCSAQEIPTNRPIGRLIRRLFESSASSRMAFGIFFVTDAEGTTLYGQRRCGCHRYGRLRTGADLLRQASLPALTPDEELDLSTLRSAVGLFQQHRELRGRLARSADPAALRRFEASLPDALSDAFPCKMLDAGGRASTLTIGCLGASGGNPAGLARTLDPASSGAPALRELLASGLRDAALRDDPCPEAVGPHLGLTYLLLARDEIESAVAIACRARECAPAELPLHLLPIPVAARERAARLALRARGVVLPDGESALEALRSTLN